MSDEIGIQSGWTIETYAAHNEALRSAEAKFEEERDRRYSEVALEREKALKIKETADLAALDLARDIQIYKDEKANALREQINNERGLYVQKGDLVALSEKIEAQLKPLSEFIAGQAGRAIAHGETRANVSLTTTLLASVIGLVLFALTLIGYSTLHRTTNTPPAQTVTVTRTP